MPTYFSVLLTGLEELMGTQMLSELECPGRCKAAGCQMSRMDHNPACKIACVWSDASMLPHAEIKAGCCFKTPMPRYAWGSPGPHLADGHFSHHRDPSSFSPSSTFATPSVASRFQVPGCQDGEISGPRGPTVLHGLPDTSH